ncbi:MAG: lipid IV(A) 3-deoxy-D-manno-octulosonic acid transferase [Gammaproteobacteria bacterium]
MRLLYSLLMYAATPLVLAYFGLRGFRDRRYWRRWGERLGWGGAPARTGAIVVHAASMGEVNAASPLVGALLDRPAPLPLLLTTFTPTGSRRARDLFGERIAHQYLPLDLPGAVRRFLDRQQPALLIIMETEIWPNLIRATTDRGIPVLLANARMTERSMRGYRRLQPFITPALGRVNRVLAQSAGDAERFVRCGARADRVSVGGNLKFDIDVPPSLTETGEMLKTSWGVTRPALVAGSTHAEDEDALFGAFRALLKTLPDALLVLAPRHPERFSGVAEDARGAGFRACLRSARAVPPRDCQVMVLDTLGELPRYYAAADLAFVGGTLSPVGGHNVLEPAALGKPVLFGPHTANVRETSERLLETGAAQRVHDTEELRGALEQLFRDAAARDRMGQAGLKIVADGRGALEHALGAVAELLPKA